MREDRWKLSRQPRSFASCSITWATVKNRRQSWKAKRPLWLARLSDLRAESEQWERFCRFRIETRINMSKYSPISSDNCAFFLCPTGGKVLLLVACGNSSSCDDYGDIAEWCETPLSFLRA